MNEIHLTKKDFEIDWFSGTGGGGQHRNKHQNCCRITHIATGLRAQSTKHRERPANQRDAFTKLAKLVVSYYSVDEGTRRRFDEDRVRTYHEPRNTVLDHASGLTLPYKYVVKSGNIGEMIDARKSVKSVEVIDGQD